MLDVLKGQHNEAAHPKDQRRENPQSDKNTNSQDSKVPASREEALSYARKNIAKAREQAAEIRLRKMARDSQTKSSRTLVTSDLESEEEKEHTTSITYHPLLLTFSMNMSDIYDTPEFHLFNVLNFK